ncbi:Mediator of RNA polymerase II transcription subunit 12-like protein [Talaromyces islandicus]|uniref:Mediator of RNA polymerase II transcription subunit 12-like protein n=1 Tax=Talaromyces islandicus TaxID=28573 RepID=A0A0U1M6U3_TALIS|nr:Mediator of RNA polymerase II transcription subunit 12-like protein [Talaromyces islandicus]
MMMRSLSQPRKQLLCHIVDERTRSLSASQDQPFCIHPVSSDLADGWRIVSFQELATAVNNLSWWIETNIGRASSRSEPVAYLGINDIRYIVFILACMKTGYVAFLPSPRNSEAAFFHLLKETGCSKFVYSPERHKTVQDLQNVNASIKAWKIPGLWEMVDNPADVYVYERQFSESENETSVIVHSSGTTGFPKPVNITHGYWTAMDNLFLLPVPPGRRACGLMNAAPGRRFFSMAPYFHLMGIYLSVISICHWAPFVLTPPEKPLTVELLARIIDETNPTVTLLLPSLIEDLLSTEKGRTTLERFEKIYFGGAPLAKSAGDKLSNLEIAIGSSEIGLIPGLVIEDDAGHADWQYFEWNPYYGIEMVQIDSEGKHEMVLHREKTPGAKKNENDRGFHCIFHTFPHLDEYRTNDMFLPHPTKPNLWKYYGRVDDVIVLSNGEKFNPIEMEKVLDGHPLISRSLIVGNGQFHSAALIEPKWDRLDDSNSEQSAFIQEIWPFVEKANDIAPAYGRLMKSKIAMASKDKPFKCTPKGSTRRGVVISEYTPEIEYLYSLEEENSHSFPKEASITEITEIVKSILADLLSIDQPTEDSDLFALGIDSLQTLRLSRLLLGALHSVYPDADANVISSQMIYSHPSVTGLSKYIYGLLHGNIEDGQPEASEEAESERRRRLSALVEKYTTGLPANKVTDVPQNKTGRVVILTGSTGSLGNYILNELLNDPQVSHIICLNRSADAKARQLVSFKEKGLSVDFTSKVDFFTADLGEPRFGLPAETFEYLKKTDVIIHNSWKVNFNHRVEAFEGTHIEGVRQLVDFSLESPKHPHIHFISSIGTIGMPGTKISVEVPFEDPETVIRQGYAESKFISERICAFASTFSGVPTTIHRVGQIAGPTTEHGLWNKQEWLPSLVATSKTLGKVPTELGNMPVDWIPVRNYQSQPVNLTDWVKELDKYSNPTEIDLQDKPALKIADFYRGLSKKGLGSLAPPAETQGAQAASETMRNLMPTTKPPPIQPMRWARLLSPDASEKPCRATNADGANCDVTAKNPPVVGVAAQDRETLAHMSKSQFLSVFPELRSFMRETIMNRSSLPRVQRELKSFQARWKGVKAGISPAVDFDFFCLLPDKDTMDRHVRLYFETVETVYRIIHYPSFLDEYESFWIDQRAARPGFVILLLMIIASVSCVASREQPKYIGDSSVTRERAVLFIEVSEWWLSRHSHKHIYLAIWQIRCLLLLAKQINNVKKKRHWAEAGNLIREAMSAGFHRDLNLFGDRVSFFDQEMRRRLWATMLELELQTSIDRGMPSAAVGVSSDSAAALNINDEDLTLDCDHLPTSKPLTQYTTCSFLHLSATSFTLRVSVNSLANDLASRSRYEEVLNYEESILKELEKLPKWTDGSSNDRASDMAHLLLDIQLRQFLILLHAPFARQTDTTNPRFSLSRMSGNHLLLLFRHDYFRGALAVCHNMYTSLSIQNNVVFGMNSKILLQYLDRVLVMLEDRISYLGTGYTHYWYICAACALLRSILDPADSKVQMEEAIGKLTRQYHRTLAGQEETRQAERNLIPAGLKRMNLPTDQSQFSADISNGLGFGAFGEEFPQIAFNETDVPLDEFFFGNPAAWTFENLWANN